MIEIDTNRKHDDHSSTHWSERIVPPPARKTMSANLRPERGPGDAWERQPKHSPGAVYRPVPP
ncbi:hypothetical protein PGT21_031382 [Puccinia graminis f. sp. tritici]|uniref:Uncharacterized protein n=1 Tax=Puccinia graminis f. sp. tritici TaxID=56615 RepID=A0A5B0RQH2_PUCGR|nr:hypothetical protein PGT21_031382 [Puccinia graminis f. sp. tritici]KAA1116784.1 hypothetical protein PGTUg99_019782 [Puccinia graminis f. sp. tritici]KAA1127582.1 hypothetical protein PGTUg99_002754 [Puccinia graminis f. sp. tritici]